MMWKDIERALEKTFRTQGYRVTRTYAKDPGNLYLMTASRPINLTQVAKDLTEELHAKISA